MNIQLASVFSTVLVLSFAIGCSGIERRQDEEASRTGVPDELSLKEDRSHLNELRKDVPEGVRRDNDELAMVLKDMASPDRDEDPNKVRDRFSRAVRKRRDTIDAQMRKEREEFNKAERERREKFLKDMQKERDDFNARKKDKDDRKDFFNDQDAKRKEFFTEQSEKRKDFESNMTQRRKDFEDHVRERQNRFNDELRVYTKTYYERKKNEGLKARMEEKQARLKREAERKANAGKSGAANVDPNVDPNVSPNVDPNVGAPSTIEQELARPPTGKLTPLQADEQ